MKKLFTLAMFALTGLLGLNAQTYTTTTLVSGLQYPVAFDIAPDGRFFCTQKGDGSTPAAANSATIRVYDVNGTFLSTFYNLSDSVNSDFERGLLGITMDPNFTSNHYVYVYYNHIWNSDERIRIVRFTEVNNVGTQPTIIFDLDVANNIPGNHVGGNLHFRPSDTTHIYFTIGDLALNLFNPTLNYANKITNPYGKVLRISKSPLAPPPTDNPYYDDGNPLATNCDWIWSYGHRNPFDFCFAPTTDSMYISENGQTTWDEMNMGHKGGFYGWANCEGFYMSGSTTTLCNAPNAIDPIEDWGAPLPAVTGILFYSSQVMPEFDNHVLVADNDYGRVYDITLGNAPVYDQFVSRTQWMDLTSTGGLTTIKQGTDGCVYAMKGGYTTNGQIYRVCPQGLGTEEMQPKPFTLGQPFPNPTNTTTTITYTMRSNTTARIALYDVFGREVAVLADGVQATGDHQLVIDPVQLGLAPGMYFCNMTSEGSTQSVNLVVE
ncbi:MAG: PQQ-dependent sugar dehydrogenase [Bacteroidia bacterium]|nr:PQQ-dependent sugar dehydrogenase [Bacteroidia bacterium]